jgi:hypothetical protein
VQAELVQADLVQPKVLQAHLFEQSSAASAQPQEVPIKASVVTEIAATEQPKPQSRDPFPPSKALEIQPSNQIIQPPIKKTGILTPAFPIQTQTQTQVLTQIPNESPAIVAQ